MAFQRTAVGLDLGSKAIKIVQVKISGAEASLERSIVIPRAKIESEGVDPSDPDELAEALHEAMTSAGVRTGGVVLALDSKDSMVRYTHMPPMASKRLATVMGYEVESVSDRMEEPLASDYSVLPTRREDGDQTILLGLAKEEPLIQRLDALEGAGITVARAIPATAALFGAWDLFGTKDDPDSADEDLVLAVDMGASHLHMVLILNNRLAFVRSATFGGDNFTEAIAQQLNLDLTDAERLKVTRGGVDESLRGVAAQTAPPMRSISGQLLGMIQSSVRFCESQAGILLPAVSRLWITGGGMRLRGLPEYLARSLGDKPFKVFEPKGNEAETGSEASRGASEASLGLALGIGAFGLGSGTQKVLTLNVLPGKYRARRQFRERTVFLYAALAMLVFFLAAQAVHGFVLRSHANERRSQLAAALKELELKRDERDESIARSTQTRTRINRRLREAEPTAFQAFVLHFLADTLRSEFQLLRIALEPVDRENDSGFDYELHIDGQVSDERRNGLTLIRELQESLANEERISDARIGPSRSEGPWYTFSLILVPNTFEI